MFYINLPVGVLAWLGLAAFVPETELDPERRFDMLGFCFLCLGLGSLQMMLDRGHSLDWFASPAGFAAVIYQGGPPLGPVQVSADQTALLDVTATDPALRDTLKALAMGALLARGTLAGSDAARADLANRAGQQLVAAQEPMAALAAKLGTVQSAVQQASIRNDAEDAALQSARLSLLSVDPYETATKYQEAQNQLQTLYAITARAARLSLVDFL